MLTRKREHWIAVGILGCLLGSGLVLVARPTGSTSAAFLVAAAMAIAFGLWFSGWLRSTVWGTAALLGIYTAIVTVDWARNDWVLVSNVIEDMAIILAFALLVLVVVVCVFGWIRFYYRAGSSRDRGVLR